MYNMINEYKDYLPIEVDKIRASSKIPRCAVNYDIVDQDKGKQCEIWRLAWAWGTPEEMRVREQVKHAGITQEELRDVLSKLNKKPNESFFYQNLIIDEYYIDGLTEEDICKKYPSLNIDFVKKCINQKK